MLKDIIKNNYLNIILIIYFLIRIMGEYPTITYHQYFHILVK